MKKTATYPFYKSLRFRFGLVFGTLFFILLAVLVFFIYFKINSQLEKSFEQTLITQATLIAQKTEINPLTIPLPGKDEKVLIAYNNSIKTDTLYNNLYTVKEVNENKADTSAIRTALVTRSLETGGAILVRYSAPATVMLKQLQQLRLLLFIYVPAAFLLTLIAGYFLSGFLLKPLNSIIYKAGKTDLLQRVELLTEPQTKDELHLLVTALNRMLERIKKQSIQQNAFFASASHELRTPLTVMITELEVILASSVSKETGEVLQNQLTEVKRLNKLVNNFLLMSKLTSGNMKADIQLTDIPDILTKSMDKLREAATKRNLSVKILLLPVDTSYEVLADSSLQQTIIFNLIENAVKYAKENSTIQVSVKHQHNSIELTVENETEKKIHQPARLMNEFYRDDYLNEGTGLGLWIVQQLVLLHQDEFSVNTQDHLFRAVVQYKHLANQRIY